MLKRFFAVAAVVSLLAPASAKAVLITGEISFTGSYATDSPDLSAATAFTNFSGVVVADAVGDYAGTQGSLTLWTPFSFDPFVGVSPLWFFIDGNNYQFDLTAVSIDFESPTALVLSGTGIAKITGFEDTPASWNFTANTSGLTFQMASSTSTVAVPEPSAFLYGGLISVLAGCGYRIKRRLAVA